MTITELVTTKVEQLSVYQQREVLNFVEFLSQKQKKRSDGPPHDPEGILAGMASGLTYEDFVALRREMWQGAPGMFTM